jgi:hypothetical protein
MQSPKFDTIARKADYLFQPTATESDRFEDDFVAYEACKDSRESIRSYFLSFLLKNHIKPKASITLANLYEQCKVIDKKFEPIDLSCFLCRHDSEHDNYCLGIDKVNPCMKVAEQTRKVVLS